MRISDWSSDVCSSDLGVGVAIDRYDDLFGRKAQLLCRALQDAHIGLVRNNPVDIARRKAERSHCFPQPIGKIHDGVAETLLAAPPELSDSPGAGRPPVDGKH